MSNYFTDLFQVNVNDKVEKKNGLSYVSWPYAWAEVKKRHPDANYTVYENANGWCYHTDGKTAWVKTGVTIEGIEHIEYLPVMDFKNRSIPLDAITSFDVNKAIQRSLTKAVARHGLGLYIYAGEDLPEGEDKPEVKPAKPVVEAPAAYSAPDNIKAFCEAQKISVKMFTSIYDALCEQGRTQRIPSTKMTEEQCTSLLTLVKSELEKAS